MQLKSSVETSAPSPEGYADSESAIRGKTSYYVVIFIFTTILTMVMVTSAHKYVVKATKSTENYKPKAYFLFWASHPFIFCIGIYSANANSNFNNSGHVFLWCSISAQTIVCVAIITLLESVALFKHHIRLNTPTHLVTGRRVKTVCHIAFVLIAALAMSFFFAFAVNTSPILLLIINLLYPSRTLIRYPLILVVIIVLVSFTALLIFQSERSGYLIKSGIWKILGI